MHCAPTIIELKSKEEVMENVFILEPPSWSFLLLLYLVLYLTSKVESNYTLSLSLPLVSFFILFHIFLIVILHVFLLLLQGCKSKKERERLGKIISSLSWSLSLLFSVSFSPPFQYIIYSLYHSLSLFLS